MKKPDSLRCENCMFAVKDSKLEGLRCKRFPPAGLVQEDDMRVWKNPLMAPWDFCGEFLPSSNLDAVEWIAWKKGLLEDVKSELPK